LDYYNIRINDAIVTPDPNTLLADCFNYFGTNPNLDASRLTCRALNRQGSFMNTVRNPFGGLGSAFTPFTVNNDNRIQTSGIDMQLSWAMPLEWVGAPQWGRLSFDVILNHLLEYKLQEAGNTLGLPEIDYAGSVSYFGQGLGTSFPRWNGVLNTAYTLGNSSVNWRARYIHSMANRAELQYVGETAFTGVPSIWYHDLSVTTNVENLMFRVGVNNLFGTNPPVYAPNVQSGTDPSLYDVIGRRFFVSVGLRY
jgi:iron complex outermembrane recepter protein